MKSQILLIATLASVALAAPLLDNAPAYNQAIIDEVNAANTTWTAGFNGRFFGVKMSAVRSWLGVLPDAKLPEVIRTVVANDIPDTFDSRTAWPKCASISTIRDQANCGSCWAFGAVEAMSDRICIASGQTNQVQLSAQHLVSCTSPITGQGCGGGYPGMAWFWWATFSGLASETDYPYALPSCDHHINGTKPPCGPEQGTPKCDHSKTEGAKIKGKSHYGVSGEAAIQTEIMTNGPVEAAFTVYEDFLAYKTGVYTHTSGQALGGHAIRILGWGVENGTPFWEVANSWNEDWGNQGYFRIARGSDECGIESGVVAGEPKL